MKQKFEGYYFKQQNGNRTVALIIGKANHEAFIQVITDYRSYHVSFDVEEYERNGMVKIEKNKFSRRGMILNIHREGIILTGNLKFINSEPVKRDIMGPLKHLPMECRHMIVSMKHQIKGSLILNGDKIDFTDGTGYIEGDRGSSFPKSYSWAQCNTWESGDTDCSIMAAVAKIPFAGLKFFGCISIIKYKGIEYRLATYKGAKVRCRTKEALVISQGKMRLTIIVPEHHGYLLYAPHKGNMIRTIYENPAVRARFVFEIGREVVVDRWSDGAGYEYVK